MSFLASPLNRALLIGVVMVIIGVFAYFSVVEPKLNQYAQSQAQLEQDQKTYTDLKRVADQKPTYIALTKQIQSRLTGVELTADPRAYIPSYLKQIENLAAQDGLQVTAVTPQATPSPSPTPSAAPGALPGASPGPGALKNVPGISNAVAAAGGSNAQTQTTNGVAAQTGATPIPGAAQPAPNASPGAGGPGPLQNQPSTSARANAIAYLNQSFSQVPINMELSGTYSQLQKFLRDLNKFPKLIGVGDVTLAPGGHQAVGETPTLNIILPIIAYRLSPSAAPLQPVTPPARNGG